MSRIPRLNFVQVTDIHSDAELLNLMFGKLGVGPTEEIFDNMCDDIRKLVEVCDTEGKAREVATAAQTR